MAKQLGNNPLSGKVDNIVYYTTKDGQRLARRAYEHTGKKVKTSPAYKFVRQYNSLFGANSWFARDIYRTFKLKLPNAVQGSFFNQFMKYMSENPSGWAGPKAKSIIVPWMNGQLRNSNWIDLPTQAPNNSIRCTQTQITFGTSIVLPASTNAILKNNGINFVDFKVFAICTIDPISDVDVLYNFLPIQIQQLTADTDIQIYADADNILVPANTQVTLSGITARNLCNYNGGSNLGFGGVFVWVGAQGGSSGYLKDFCMASYIVPYGQSL